MIKSVHNYPVSQLFDTEASIVYVIPRYQREYIWTRAEWERLFDDIADNNPGYFLGSLICINQSTDTLAVQELEVVDGQQRLTTLSLLFAAVLQYLGEGLELDDERQVERINLKRRLVLKKESERIRVVPQIQNNNQNDYRAILAETRVIGACDVPAYAGNRKIYRTFRYFRQRLQELAREENNQVNTILDFLQKVNQASLVKIEVASHADAYILFESLNNRGVPLTAVDLIKNKLLARLERSDPGKVDDYFMSWNRLLGYLGEDYNIQERFFRHYYNAFKEDLNAPFRKDGDRRKDPLGPVARRSNMLQIFEALIDHEPRSCLEQLVDAGSRYAWILGRRQDELPTGLVKPLQDLERIQGAPSYLLLLYLLMNGLGRDEEPRELIEVVQLLVRFFVRRNLTDIPPTRDLITIFMAAVDIVKGAARGEAVERLREHLIQVSAPDADFLGKLSGPVYEENSGVTRFVLCALAEQGMTKESWQDLWRAEGRRYVWTIEHIFPQGETIPDSWVEMIAAGDVARAKEFQQSHVHKLGNLTISGFNSTLGNKSFTEKRDRTDSEGRYVGYRNVLVLNRDLATTESWSIEQIDLRTAKLVGQAAALFDLRAKAK